MNKILMEFRGKDDAHVAWVKALKVRGTRNHIAVHRIMHQPPNILRREGSILAPSHTWAFFTLILPHQELLVQLEAYLTQYYPQGLVWNAQGSPLASAMAAAAPPAAGGPVATRAPPPAPRPGGGPPPPPPPPGPPPPPLSVARIQEGAGGAKSGGSGGGGNMAALFKEISKVRLEAALLAPCQQHLPMRASPSEPAVPLLPPSWQGEGVTVGLKKVTDDMKTKNRADRVSTVTMPDTAPAPSSSAGTSRGAAGGAGGGRGGGGGIPTGPAKLELNDRKWTVEYQVGGRSFSSVTTLCVVRLLSTRWVGDRPVAPASKQASDHPVTLQAALTAWLCIAPLGFVYVILQCHAWSRNHWP